MEIGKAADELKALRLTVAREVENFTNRTGIVIELDVRPQFRRDVTFDPESNTVHRLICYLVEDKIISLTSRKAVG